MVLFNGYKVAELDYSAMHPHLLYAWQGIQCPDNFYEQIVKELGLSYNNVSKFVVKSVVLMSINASNEAELKKAIAYDSYKESKRNDRKRIEGRNNAVKLVLRDEMERLGCNHTHILKAFATVHSDIAKYVYSNSSYKLMLDESNIMTKVMFRLMNLDMLSAPIHDSLLFPEQYKSTVRVVMLNTYKKLTGFEIEVK